MSQSGTLPLLTLRLFGAPVITLEGEHLRELTSVKARALLFYLAVTGQPHRRTTLAALFWPDSKHALGSLRTALAVLGKHLPGYVDADREHVGLHWERIWLDTAKFTDLQQAGDPDELIQYLQAAAALYRGEFMAGFHVEGAPEFEQWQAQTRYRFEQHMVTMLMRLADAYAEQQDDAAESSTLAQLLTLDPGHEAAHRRKMRLFAGSGQRAAAIQQFERCRRYLADELGVDPAPETLDLYAQILEGEPSSIESHHPVADAATAAQVVAREPVADLRDMPGRSAMIGRQRESTLLDGWLVENRSALVMIWGMGGIGKTTLSTEIVYKLMAQSDDDAAGFQQFVWRTLRNAPPLDELLDSWIYSVVPEMQTMMPVTTDEKLALLFHTLAHRRCLLVLDNLETIMGHGTQHDVFRPGFEGYRRLIEQFAHGRHASCLLITTRQLPAGLKRLEASSARIHLLQLHGLPAEAGMALLRKRNVMGRPDTLHTLVEHYSGNPLALNLVASVVNDYYGGNIDAYIQYGASVFDDIRTVLDEQFARATDLMRDLLVWLAVLREPVGLEAVRSALVVPPSPRELLEAVRSLARSSLIQNVASEDPLPTDDAPGPPLITLQNVVMEYLSDRLLTTVQSELASGKADYLHRFGLRKASAPEYVQAMQSRLFLAPTTHWLLQTYGMDEAQNRLQAMLDEARTDATIAGGYLPANMLHLKLHLSSPLRGDFSGLTLREADLRAATLVDVDLRNTDLSTARFADSFGNVFAVAISPDSRYLAAASVQSVYVWELATLKPVRVLRGQSGIIAEIVFAPDGRELASTSYDGLIVIWSIETGQETVRLQSPVGHLNALALSADGQLLACGGYSGMIAVWDLRLKSWRMMFDAGTRVVGLCFTAGNEIAASVGFRCEVQIWQVDQKRLVKILRGGDVEQVGRAAIVGGQSIIAVAHGDEIRVWDWPSGELRCVLCWSQEWVHGLAISPNEDTVASAHSDGTITIWNLHNHERAEVLTGHHGTVRSLTFIPDGKQLVSGGYDGTVRLWNLRHGVEEQRLHGCLRWANAMKFSKVGNHLACATLTGDVHLWRSRNRKDYRVLRGHESAVRALAIDPHSRLLATGSDDCTVRVWELKTGRLRHVLSGHRGFVRAVEFDRTGRYLASGSHDTTMCVWDTETGGQRRVFTDASTTIADSMDFHPHEDLLAYGSIDGNVYLADVESGDVHASISIPSQASTLVFSHCGRFLACGAFDGSVTVWKLDRNQDTLILTERFRQAPSSRCVWRLKFSPNSAQITWNCERTDIFTARVADGELLYRIEGNHIGECITYSANGTALICDDASGEITVRVAATGRVLHHLTDHRSPPTAVAVDPMTGVIASCDNAGAIIYWDAASGKQVAAHLLHTPYQGARIAGATGLTESMRQALLGLGARE